MSVYWEPRTIIATATVPGTPVTIEITRRQEGTRVLFETTRETNGCGFVNYLSFGRFSETEARQIANFLWKDTIARRNANR